MQLQPGVLGVSLPGDRSTPPNTSFLLLRQLLWATCQSLDDLCQSCVKNPLLLLQEVEKGEEDIVEVSMSNASLIVSETKASAACLHRHAIWLGWLGHCQEHTHEQSLLHRYAARSCWHFTIVFVLLRVLPAGLVTASETPIQCSYCTAMHNLAEHSLLL